MKPSKGPRKPKKRRITFRLHAPEASQVFLVGDFNGWNTEAHPLHKDGDGQWVTELSLAAGTFEYKFLADGRWLTDPDNLRHCPNCFGSENSVLTIAS
jgi:1,4-alpha-glucan branching enzyme